MFAVPAAKHRWTCRQCMKTLCSKRSYDEHMNIHNKARPYACEDCDYAAASQMTLTRHRQRRHTPRQEWHYQCPYCGEPYMEPASYRQHVLARHYGRSATFGCPYGDCPFRCKSSKAFREHVGKHQAVILSRIRAAAAQAQQNPHQPQGPKFDLDNLVLYMVDDECGIGNVAQMPRKFAVLYSRKVQAKQMAPPAQPPPRTIVVLNSKRPSTSRTTTTTKVVQRRVEIHESPESEMVTLINVDLLDDDQLRPSTTVPAGIGDEQQWHGQNFGSGQQQKQQIPPNFGSSSAEGVAAQPIVQQVVNNNLEQFSGNVYIVDQMEPPASTVAIPVARSEGNNFEQFNNDVAHRYANNLEQFNNNFHPQMGPSSIPTIKEMDTVEFEDNNHYYEFEQYTDADEWIEAEVVIDDQQMGEHSTLPDGQTDDFGLD